MVMQEYRKSLIDFCANYRGLKLCINTRNVGHSFSQMVHTPGGNRVLHSLHLNYSNNAFEHEVENIQTYEHEPVCKETALMLAISSARRYGPDYLHLGLVGKLSTSKYDREESEAYIATDTRDVFHLKLHKLDIEDYIIVQRENNIPLIEDYAICQAIISRLTNGIETMPELGNGFMKKLDLLNKD